jgi:hypothetical protein
LSPTPTPTAPLAIRDRGWHAAEAVSRPSRGSPASVAQPPVAATSPQPRPGARRTAKRRGLRHSVRWLLSGTPTANSAAVGILLGVAGILVSFVFYFASKTDDATQTRRTAEAYATLVASPLQNHSNEERIAPTLQLKTVVGSNSHFTGWNPSVEVQPGDVIEVLITVTNTSDMPAPDVQIWGTEAGQVPQSPSLQHEIRVQATSSYPLSPLLKDFVTIRVRGGEVGMRYYPYHAQLVGITSLYNCVNSCPLSDRIIAGISVGDIPPGGSVAVSYLAALSAAPTSTPSRVDAILSAQAFGPDSLDPGASGSFRLLVQNRSRDVTAHDINVGVLWPQYGAVRPELTFEISQGGSVVRAPVAVTVNGDRTYLLEYIDGFSRLYAPVCPKGCTIDDIFRVGAPANIGDLRPGESAQLVLEVGVSNPR